MAKANRIQNRQNKPIKTGFHRKKKTGRGNFVVQDEFAIQAQKAGYRARSIYKLLEIQERFELIKPDYVVLDVGCAPGSFLQGIRNIVKQNTIVGIDLKPCKPFSHKNIHTIVGDIFDYNNVSQAVTQIIGSDQFDIITSDIAPNTTGRKDVDQYASVELNIEIVQFSDRFLKKGGNLLLKVFQGEDFNDLTQQIKKRFTDMKVYKPRACRDSSHEVYVICFEKKA
ncbi:RlmE family RNA methyltransferase [Candidatus Gracilibacteria bacterium]|nr:RlmE family RNA methyltransferase [Candidatus Gracilibacteria bacterium]